MSRIPPWASGAFELIVHAQGHFLKGGDLDRRMALISFDNAIETSLVIFLTIPKKLRRQFVIKKEDLNSYRENYYSKLDFLDHWLEASQASWKVEREFIFL